MELFGFIPSLGSAAWTIVAFVLVLSIIVSIHEYGHYIVGRWCGIHAEVFSLGFGPVLFSRVDKRGTKWQIAAVPFGGYVKFLGDADAASRPDAGAVVGMTPAERRHTMQGAPLWARAATVAAGPIFNFILSTVIYIGLVLYQGVQQDQPTVASLQPTPFAGASLLPGDKIIAINGNPTPDAETLNAVVKGLPAAPSVIYSVERGASTTDVAGPYPQPALANYVQPGSAAEAAGVLEGDVILAINGTPISTFDQMRDIAGASDGKPLTLKIWRDGAELEKTMTPKQDDVSNPDGTFERRWLIGLSGTYVFTQELRPAGPVEAMKLGAVQTYDVITRSLTGLYSFAVGDISKCTIRGAVSIAKVSGQAASLGLVTFIAFVAMLSTGVGLLNLFPIPVLDGGHLVFYAYEAIFRRPPSDAAMRVLMSVGLVVIISFMIFGLTNDFTC